MTITNTFTGLVGIGVVIFYSACRFGSLCVDRFDGSGGGSGGGGSTGGAGGNGIPLNLADGSNADGFDPNLPTETRNCGLTAYDVTIRPADVLLLLDRSDSMNKHEITGLDGQMVTRTQAAKDAVNTIIQQTEKTIAWGLKMFPEGSAEYCVVTPDTVDVEPKLSNYAAISQKIVADNFDGDGTPTAAAVTAGANYLKNVVKDTNPKYLILATDGEPSRDDQNQCTGSWAIPDVKTAAVNAVDAAAKDGIKTYLIGVNTTSSSNVIFNQIVQAGLTPDPPIPAGEDITSTKNTSQHYYSADDASTLLSALGKITGKVSDCRFSLGKNPPLVPDNVVVKVTDSSGTRVRVPVDRIHSNGWDYTGPDQLTIQVYGSWCDKVKAPIANNQVSIIFGCQGQIIP
jgi:hypothetical protein